jgi:8-oxo-dGTP pyrophosphatase MutT (NUDIX family)
VWIARRSTSKAIDAGRLDNIVGGRIAAGTTVDETLRKEAWEEAGIPPALLKDVPCLSAVRVEYSVPRACTARSSSSTTSSSRSDFKPTNQDGEVAEIKLMPLEDVVQEILAGEFTLDAGTVMVDGLLRQGILSPRIRCTWRSAAVEAVRSRQGDRSRNGRGIQTAVAATVEKPPHRAGRRLRLAMRRDVRAALRFTPDTS